MDKNNKDFGYKLGQSIVVFVTMLILVIASVGAWKLVEWLVTL